MKQIFALTSALLAADFTDQYSDNHLFQTLCMVGQRTGVKFDKEQSTYKLTGQWLNVLEAYDILLDFLLTEGITKIKRDSESDVSFETLGQTDVLSRSSNSGHAPLRYDGNYSADFTGSQQQPLCADDKLEIPVQPTLQALMNAKNIKVEKTNDRMPVKPGTDSHLVISDQQLSIESEYSDEQYLKGLHGSEHLETSKVSKRKPMPFKMLLSKEKQCKKSQYEYIKLRREKPVKLTVKKKRGRKRKIRDKDEVFKCVNCNYVGKTLYHLNNHLKRLHDIGNRYRCDQCNKSYGVNADLTRHKKTVHETPVFVCEICTKSYKSKAGYDEHIKSHQEDYIKPIFNCVMCNKNYSSKLGLAHHVKGEHLGMKNSYLCSTCGQSFTNKAAYVGHSNLHAGLKPHSCEKCGKRFAFQKSLWEHRRTHDDVCRYTCDVCGKTFRQNQSLRVHKKIHEDVRDHSCPICGRAFTQKQALNRHERIHSGALPFECLLCGKHFYDTSIIRRHVIFIHKKEPSKWREDIMTHIDKKKETEMKGASKEMLSPKVSVV